MPEQPFEMLLVEDNPGDARLLVETLNDAPSASFDVDHVERLDAAIEKLAARGYDIILLDLALPDSIGLDTFRAIHSEHADIPIVVLSGLDDEQTATQAVQEGAQDYLVKGQIGANMLARSLRYAIERHTSKMQELEQYRRGGRGRVIGFMGARGGVGTTTVALNVCALLARGDHSVVGAEMWPDIGSFSQYLDYDPSEDLSHIMKLDPAQITEREVRMRLVNLPFGPSILFSPQHASDYGQLDPAAIEAVLSSLQGMADYVILDLPRQPNESTEALVRRCDFVCVVLNPDRPSVRAAAETVRMLMPMGMVAEVIGAVVISKSSVYANMPMELVQNRVGVQLMGVMPPAAEACMSAMQMGVPMAVAHDEHVAVTTLSELADRLSADTLVGMQL